MGQPLLRYARVDGDKVALRPLRVSDADVGFSMIYQHEPILEWLVWQGPESLDALRERFGSWRRGFDQGHGYTFAIEELRTHGFVGTMGLRCIDNLSHVELGYWVGEQAWGRGFGTEAIRLAAYVAFQHLNATVVTAEVFVGNQASCHVLERNGFQRERRVHRAIGVREGARGAERWFYTLTRGDHRRAQSDYRPNSVQVDPEEQENPAED